MAVIPLTLTISLCLVFTFVLFFLREYTRRRFSSAESEALLPLAEEGRRTVSAAEPLVLELRGRNPRRRLGGCGRHPSDADHPRCGDCSDHAG